MNTAERRLRKRTVDGLAGPDQCIDTDTDRGANPGVYGDGGCDFRSIPAAPSLFTESDSAQGTYASTYGSADQCAIRQRIRSTLFDFDGIALPEFANAAAGFQSQ
jgi:hypothetical protein